MPIFSKSADVFSTHKIDVDVDTNKTNRFRS